MASPGSEEEGRLLLRRPDGSPMDLHLDVLPDERRTLTQLVQRRGGCVVINPARHEYALTFSDGVPGSIIRANMIHRPDTFSTRFIYDSVEAGFLAKLLRYRLQAKSSYKYPGDVQRVLLGLANKNDLVWFDQCSDDDEEEDDPLMQLLQPTPAEEAAELGRAGTAYKRREKYSTEKDAAIVRFVAERAKWATKSPTAPLFWQRASSRLPPELAPHSASSLWTHFIRQVLPNLADLKPHVTLRELALVASMCEVPSPLNEEELELLRQRRSADAGEERPMDQSSSASSRLVQRNSAADEGEEDSELRGETTGTPEGTADGASGAVSSPMLLVGSGDTSLEYESDEGRLVIDLSDLDEETEITVGSVHSEDSTETVIREENGVEDHLTRLLSGRDLDEDSVSTEAIPGTPSCSPSPLRLRIDPTPPGENPSGRVDRKASPDLGLRTGESSTAITSVPIEPIDRVSPSNRVGRGPRFDPSIHSSPNAGTSLSPRTGRAAETEQNAAAPAATRTSSPEFSSKSPSEHRTRKRRRLRDVGNTSLLCISRGSGEDLPEKPDVSRRSSSGGSDSRSGSTDGRQPGGTPRRSSGRRSVSPGSSAARGRREYSSDEQTALLQRLLSDSSGDTLGGNKLWKRIERERCVPGRSWQSLRQHFLVSMRPRLHQFKLSVAERKRLGGEAGPEPAPQRVRASRPYLRRDDVRVLRWLLRCPRSLLGVRGRETWTMMADSEFREERTWQSLKQRFMHHILPNLQRYKEVNVESRSMIREAAA